MLDYQTVLSQGRAHIEDIIAAAGRQDWHAKQAALRELAALYVDNPGPDGRETAVGRLLYLLDDLTVTAYYAGVTAPPLPVPEVTAELVPAPAAA